jgi:hypothetical protein
MASCLALRAINRSALARDSVGPVDEYVGLETHCRQYGTPPEQSSQSARPGVERML